MKRLCVFVANLLHLAESEVLMKLVPDPREPIIAIAPWQRFAICTLIFLLAFGVRVLSLHDTRLEVAKVQTGVAADYERVAFLLRQGGPSSFFRATSPLARHAPRGEFTFVIGGKSAPVPGAIP